MSKRDKNPTFDAYGNKRCHHEDGYLLWEEYNGDKYWYLDGVCCRFDEWIDYFT